MLCCVSLCHHLYQIPVLSSISKSYRVPFLQRSECLHSHRRSLRRGRYKWGLVFFKGEHNEALWRHGSSQITRLDFNQAPSKKNWKAQNKRHEGRKKKKKNGESSPEGIDSAGAEWCLFMCPSCAVIFLSQVQVQPACQQLRVRQGEAGLRVRTQYHGVRLQPLQEALPRKSLECGLLPPHTQRNGKYMWVHNSSHARCSYSGRDL